MDEPAADDTELLGGDLLAQPREVRWRRARTFLRQLAEDDWTQVGFVVEAARAVAGRDAAPEALRDTVVELYRSFVDDARVAVLDAGLRFHYADPDRLRSDILAAWPDAAAEPSLGVMPWLTWRDTDETPPGP